MLSVDDKQLGRTSTTGLRRTDLPRADLRACLPEHQRADWVAAVHRVEEVACLRRRPDKRTLDVRQTDPPNLDVLDEVAQGVAGVAVQGWGHRSSLSDRIGADALGETTVGAVATAEHGGARS